MILDGHVHIRGPCHPEGQRQLIENLRAAGVDGAALISLPPASHGRGQTAFTPQQRLENLLRWCDAGPNLYPLYWIDPMEPDALSQVATAVDAGVFGFKIICSHFSPGERRALDVYREIARTRRPILFHSGILWDGAPSSDFCRPTRFEALLEVEGITFALAHISWPWCDECIAVYGKIIDARRRVRDLAVDMFIDVTPGTPPLYRREALTRLFRVGYPVEERVFFGTDCVADGYHPGWASEWVKRDRDILRDLGCSAQVQENYFSTNLQRFLGFSEATGSGKVPGSSAGQS